MQPLFSVITAVRNGLRDIPGYLQGLIEQSYPHWEAIIVDDGSSDGSYELLQQITEDDPRFRLARNTLSKQIAGPYQARNVGLELARGDFVCFLDIDDRWLPHKLAVQAQQLNADQQLKLLVAPYIRMRRGSKQGRVRRPLPLFPPQTWVRIANPIPMLTACVQRELIADLRFEPQHHEDYLYWHAVLQRLTPDQVANAGSPLAIYSIHDTSISSNKFRATGWIWRCYRRFGYGRLQAAAALFARGLLQAWLLASELGRGSTKLATAEP